MVQFIYKSGLMTGVLVMVSVIFVFCGVSYFNQKDVFRPFAGMSEEYAVFYSEDGWDTVVPTILSRMQTMDPYRIKGVKLERGCAACIKDEKLLMLSDGRLFYKQDYEQGTDTVLVRQDVLQLCQQVDGQNYLTINEKNYRVVGVYRDSQSNDVRSSDYILNLYAKSIQETMVPQYGFVDDGSRSVETASEALKDLQNVQVKKAAEAAGILNRNVLNGIQGMLIQYVAVGIFVLGNIFAAISVWLKGKKKEIVIRKMTGGTRVRIWCWLMKNFLTFFVGSFAIAVAIVGGMIKAFDCLDLSPSVSLMLGQDMEWLGVAVAFGVTGILCGGIASVILLVYLKKEIIQLIHE